MSAARSYLVLAAGLALDLACSGTAQRPIRVTTRAELAGTRLVLEAGPHLKINARLAPALELDGGGTVVRFTARRLTPDSAYFAEPPSATLPGRHPAVHGTLRASVCRDDEQVCRSVRVRI
jgi:hypothetical protein